MKKIQHFKTCVYVCVCVQVYGIEKRVAES